MNIHFQQFFSTQCSAFADTVELDGYQKNVKQSRYWLCLQGSKNGVIMKKDQCYKTFYAHNVRIFVIS
jgi:hypothetical protein